MDPSKYPIYYEMIVWCVVSFGGMVLYCYWRLLIVFLVWNIIYLNLNSKWKLINIIVKY